MLWSFRLLANTTKITIMLGSPPAELRMKSRHAIIRTMGCFVVVSGISNICADRWSCLASNGRSIYCSNLLVSGVPDEIKCRVP